MKDKLLNVLNNFRNKRLLIVGDLMLDKYIWGEVSRISPEAPVQVVKVDKETYAPGGAANVANNAASLNSKVCMVGIVGDDREKDILLGELKKRSIDTSGILVDKDRPTTLKVRVLGRSQQLLRIDYENDAHSHNELSEKMIKFLESKIDEIDAVVISDYAKGVMSSRLSSRLIELATKKNKVLVVDPKPKHRDLYKNATLITPNRNEALMMAGAFDGTHDIAEIGKKLVSLLNSNLLITQGEKGMSLFEKNGQLTEVPTKAKEVYDVIGAGDTVVATAALALCSNADFKEAAILSNIAAGIKVGRLGTSTVTVEEIIKALKNKK